MGTTAHPGPFDVDAAAAAEPIFTLRANDPVAAGVVREWVRRVKVRTLVNKGYISSTTRAKCAEALDCAEEMERWKRTVEAEWGRAT